MAAISIGDAELYYEEEGQGPPLLLVPGLEGGGHFVPQIMPAAYNAAVGGFLRAQLTR